MKKTFKRSDILKALDYVYEVCETPELPIKEWDVDSVVRCIKQRLKIEEESK